MTTTVAPPAPLPISDGALVRLRARLPCAARQLTRPERGALRELERRGLLAYDGRRWHPVCVECLQWDALLPVAGSRRPVPRRLTREGVCQLCVEINAEAVADDEVAVDAGRAAAARIAARGAR